LPPSPAWWPHSSAPWGYTALAKFRVVVRRPLTALVVAFLVIAFLGVWSNFVGRQLILSSADRQPLAVAINSLRGVYGDDGGLIMAGTLFSIAPIMALFLLLQREFISGLTAGAVKG
jgi:multiple sugar transport system permease protein